MNSQFSGALLERYTLDREAARTESGVLYDATEKSNGRRVSIEIANDLDDEARANFERDAMISQRLEGEHVLRVLEVGALIDGTPYVVREPALGSLAHDVSSRGPLPTAEAVAWTLEICEALAEAHSRGIAHGDIRAETVFLGRDDRGNPIAKVRWTSKAKAERAAREDVARDITGTALLLRFLITGETQLGDDAVKTLPNDLAHAVARATAKNPESRFTNIGEFASAIARWAPPGHQSARNISFLLSRAGIVGAPVPIPVSQRMTTPNPVPAVNALPLSDAVSAPPPSSRRVPIRERQLSQPGLNEEWFAPRSGRTMDSLLPPSPRRRTGAGWAVAMLLIGATLFGTLFLWKNGQLPQWSGTAPPMDEGKMEPVSHAALTNGLVDTTLMTPPAALEKNESEKAAAPASHATTTTKVDDEIEMTESAPSAKPAPPPMDTKPSDTSSSSSSKAKSGTDTKPADPWPGTAPPPTPSPSTTSTTDDTTPGGMSPAPTPAPPDLSGSGTQDQDEPQRSDPPGS